MSYIWCIRTSFEVVFFKYISQITSSKCEWCQVIQPYAGMLCASGFCCRPITVLTLYKTCWRDSDIQFHLFVDDCQLYVSLDPACTTSHIESLTYLENYIADLSDWMLQNKLKLNDDKTEYLLIGSGVQKTKINSKFEIGSRRSVSPDGTWLKHECVRLEPFSWSSRSGFAIVGHKEGPTYSPTPPPQ